MKRSDAVILMSKAWRDFIDDEQNRGIKNGMKDVLAALEKAGMLPPPVNHHEGQEFRDCLFWEKENET